MQTRVELGPHNKTVANSLGEPAPLSKRCGTPQQVYEKAFAGVVNRILDEGYQVIALSTCTGTDAYPKDARLVALHRAHHLNDPSRHPVATEEPTQQKPAKFPGPVTPPP
ncbi:hypothetical protein KCA24_35630 [Escherichia coli]|nr:hypothetical protein [Escherichia coli]